MAIGAIGNAIFVNQMTANASSVQNAHNNRVDFQNMVAQAAANEKDEKVLEVRPTEENQEVDPDREHQKNEADQENARSKHEESEEEETQESEFPVHKLDIKV
jgi:archaellum component FlaD/FlaE